MKWPALLESAIALMAARSALAGIEYRRTGEFRKATPHSIGYTVIATPSGDGRAVLVLQLDLWGPSYPAVLEMEREVRAALDRPLDFVGPLGFRLSSECEDGRDGPDAEPGVAHRMVDVTMRAARN